MVATVHRLLVVEDEVVVGIFLREELQDAGFEVVVLNDAESALESLRAKPFDAAIIDVALPGMSGIELMMRCRETRPNFPVVLATGIDSGALDPALTSDHYVRVLGKPYEAAALFDCLTQMDLHGQRAGISL
jgi:DNA-binding response OmpR family regulator